jgi:16S rRNA (cytosine1402-N4)-methyltransferase
MTTTTDTEREATIHKPVLLHEVINGLKLRSGYTVLDGTVNGGGHSRAICDEIGESGTLVGIDMDTDALKRADKRLRSCPSEVHLAEGNFRDMDVISESHHVEKYNGILLDLGFSSDQLERSGRGFSLRKDEPLFLTFSADPKKAKFTAHDIVNQWEEPQIADVLYGYGEERFARRIAERIVTERKAGEIATTSDLIEVVEQAVPRWYRHGRLHPATRTFQALRIAVNDEIENLREGVKKAFELLAHGARLAIISFHSIEDRVVKRAFENAAREGRGTIITKKPITPGREEVGNNPRARSAKLRIFESN